MPGHADVAIALGHLAVAYEAETAGRRGGSPPAFPRHLGEGAWRRHPDDVRHGATSLFAALDVKTGTIIGRGHRRHRAVAVRKFLDAIDPGGTGRRELQMRARSLA